MFRALGISWLVTDPTRTQKHHPCCFKEYTAVQSGLCHSAAIGSTLGSSFSAGTYPLASSLHPERLFWGWLRFSTRLKQQVASWLSIHETVASALCSSVVGLVVFRFFGFDSIAGWTHVWYGVLEAKKASAAWSRSAHSLTAGKSLCSEDQTRWFTHRRILATRWRHCSWLGHVLRLCSGQA